MNPDPALGRTAQLDLGRAVRLVRRICQAAGRLSQTAYGLFLFMRDLAGGHVVGWIDERLATVDLAPAPDRPMRLRQALLEPLGNIYGVSNKVLAMALSDLLLAGDAKRSTWI